MFIGEDAEQRNEDHDHLEFASIGWLWTDEENTRKQRRIAGEAELVRPPTSMGKWGRARYFHQIHGWFGCEPDFIITLYAPYAGRCDDASFCALVEHELYHCGQERDEFGAPKFVQSTGLPKYAILGHDVEEFVGVVRRYGVGAAAGKTAALVDAANRAPEIEQASVVAMCGTCG